MGLQVGDVALKWGVVGVRDCVSVCGEKCWSKGKTATRMR